jgi:peptidyl-prolyl cis-trans isomerase SurA
MKQILISMAAMLLVFTVKAQDTRALMNIGGDDISVQEFLNIYNKNNTNNVVDKKTMEEYVDLFVNFKLKVKEAESLGMDTAEKFVRELSGYRNQLAQPYLIDRSINEQLIEEAYKRMKEDVAAYHILLRIEPNASPADTMKTLNDLKKIAKGIKNETDMKRVIAELKADGKENTIAEDLGYFTAFSMVYPFENAAYNTPVGTLSQPIRTRFG